MKRFLWFIACMLLALSAEAQELTITYSVRFDVTSPDAFAEAGLPEDMRRSLANAYKDVRFTVLLIYKDGESNFRMQPVDKDQTITFMGQTVNVAMAMKASGMENNYSYKNHSEGIGLDHVTVLGQKYRLTSSLDSVQFTVDKGQVRKILDYECYLATSADGKIKVWYTPHIPLKNEPIATGLEGLALEVWQNAQVFTAVKIEEGASGAIIRPTEGKKMNKSAFEKMIKERVEMMKRGQ